LQDIASKVKGKNTPRIHSIGMALNAKKADDDEFKSCNGDVPDQDNDAVNGGKNQSPVTVNRTWWAPPKCITLLQPHRDDSKISRGERTALALRASKKAQILRSKRNRGESLASASSQIEEKVPHSDI
jgi:hypothetical protein